MGTIIRAGPSEVHREVVVTQSCLNLRISEVSDGQEWLIIGLLEGLNVLKVNMHTTGGLYNDCWVQI